MSDKILSKLKPGVATGEDVKTIFKIAKANSYALPAVNVVSTNSVNAVLEAAKLLILPYSYSFPMEVLHFMQVKVCPTKGKRLPLPVQFQVPSIFTICLSFMEFL
jgi:fructose/tagatose bisphosphate aldolase